MAIIWMASAPSTARGQSSWPSYPNNTAISITSGGNVGIGTTTPDAGLNVATTTSINFDRFVTGQFGSQVALRTARGSVGSPSTVQVGDNIARFSGQGYDGSAWSGNVGQLTFTASESFTTTRRGTYFTVSTVATGTTALTERLRVDPAGNVGIGTTTPQYQLAVNGTIGAKEVIVTNTGWPDYVFRPGYRLRPLSEVAAYIRAHRHLPDIPSEAEVKEKGVSVGQMQAKLLAKIEELTLHMIQADERNNRLEQQNQELRERLVQLETRVAAR